MPRVLLTTAFKPFGIDDQYGRELNFPECYHNRLTREQGIFSMRSRFNAFGLHAIAHNLDGVPVTVLEYPTLERFKQELKKGYDYLGIGFFICNFPKIKKMVEEARAVAPKTKIILGGYGAQIENLESLVDVDYICIGEGISFMRRLLGLPEEFKFKNPDIVHWQIQFMGVPIFWARNPQVITGLGCYYRCDFCHPCFFFGQKYHPLIADGKELFQETLRVKRRFRSTNIGFLGDDNFLLDLKRAKQFWEIAVKEEELFEIFIFGSADRIIKFGVEKLAEMGIGSIWIGRESKFSNYRKNQDQNLKEIIEELHKYGIKVTLSSILFFDFHTPENIWEDINDHIAHRPDFSMLSVQAAFPGTPLYERLKEEGRLLKEIPYEEWHGLKYIWYLHPHFHLSEVPKIRQKAVLKEYHQLGPSALRYIQTELKGYKYLKNSTRPILRKRAEFYKNRSLRSRVILLAMEKLVPTKEMREMVRETRREFEAEFGKSTPVDWALAGGLIAFGKKQELKMKYFGDVIQPSTKVYHYNY